MSTMDEASKKGRTLTLQQFRGFARSLLWSLPGKLVYAFPIDGAGSTDPVVMELDGCCSALAEHDPVLAAKVRAWHRAQMDLVAYVKQRVEGTVGL